MPKKKEPPTLKTINVVMPSDLIARIRTTATGDGTTPRSISSIVETFVAHCYRTMTAKQIENVLDEAGAVRRRPKASK